jgi:uncharacterized protein (DUF488 family)
MANKTISLLTIGYEGLELSEFIEILRQNKVEIIADIRAVPNSRKKGFSKKALSEELARHGIDYILIQALGSPKDLRDKVRADNDYDSFFIAYHKFLETQSEPLKQLFEIASKRNTCILCYERDINCCHRKAVVERLQKIVPAKLKLIHLNQPEQE